MKHPSKHILLIEDNDHHAVFIERKLLRGKFTCSVHRVIMLEEALEYLSGHNVDAVLLDLNLPDSRGILTVEKLTALFKAIPVVVLTSLRDEELAIEALHYGAQDYLCKDQLIEDALSRAIAYSIERKRLQRIKDDFVAIVSHELRTPLTSIYGALRMITATDGDAMSETSQEMLSIALRNSERLTAIVNDLLDLKKIEAGKLKIMCTPIDLIAMIRQSIEENKMYTEKQQINVQFSPAESTLWIKGDPARLGQVMANLLSNAAKFSPPGSTITVTAKKTGARIQVCVIDQGIGIPESARGNIFSKFTQVDSSTQRGQNGTGLGLFITRQIIELHGGTINFDSEAGQGTRFHFELPALSRASLPDISDDYFQEAVAPFRDRQ